jgi:hypothetical protein
MTRPTKRGSAKSNVRKLRVNTSLISMPFLGWFRQFQSLLPKPELPGPLPLPLP